MSVSRGARRRRARGAARRVASGSRPTTLPENVRRTAGPAPVVQRPAARRAGGTPACRAAPPGPAGPCVRGGHAPCRQPSWQAGASAGRRARHAATAGARSGLAAAAAHAASRLHGGPHREPSRFAHPKSALRRNAHGVPQPRPGPAQGAGSGQRGRRAPAAQGRGARVGFRSSCASSAGGTDLAKLSRRARRSLGHAGPWCVTRQHAASYWRSKTAPHSPHSAPHAPDAAPHAAPRPAPATPQALRARRRTARLLQTARRPQILKPRPLRACASSAEKRRRLARLRPPRRSRQQRSPLSPTRRPARWLARRSRQRAPPRWRCGGERSLQKLQPQHPRSRATTLRRQRQQQKLNACGRAPSS